MYNVINIAETKKLNRFNDHEMELCCMIANRFTDHNLQKAAFKILAYARNDRIFPREPVRGFINMWIDEFDLAT